MSMNMNNNSFPLNVNSFRVGTSMTQQNYKAVQFIAYEIKTNPAFAVAPYPNDNPAYDVVTRIQVLFGVMEFCYKQLVNDQSTTLKIFVAPEFYGRYHKGQNNGNNHYSVAQVKNALFALKDKCYHDERFRDWLVIPGSYIASDLVLHQYRIFNYVNVFSGDGTVDHIILKKDVSGIDGLDPNFKGGSNEYLFRTGETGVALAEFKPIEVRNLNIGLEVCLDHSQKRLRTYSLEKGPVFIDVHVLTACGMSTNSQNIFTKNGGYFFRNDGQSHPLYWGSIDLCVHWDNDIGPKNLYESGLTDSSNSKMIFQQQLPQLLQLNPGDQTSRVTIYPVHPI